MEIDVAFASMAMAKTVVDRMEYQKHERCWGCGLHRHVRVKCSINPSKPYSFIIVGEEEDGSTGLEKGWAWD